MRMARVNVYLPDDLAAQAKAAGLNVSGLTQEAIESALAALGLTGWIASQPDGLVVTIPDADALGDSIRAAVAAGIPVISMNSGSDVFADLGVLVHVGQTEYEAGLIAGQQFAAEGVGSAICINQEVGNTALDDRCQGFEDGLGVEVDVIPVDIVVAAIIAVAALGPACSSSRAASRAKPAWAPKPSSSAAWRWEKASGAKRLSR